MTDFSVEMNKAVARPELGNALRNELYGKMTDILERSDNITDSGTRLIIQACCLDMISALEDMIEDFGLDRSLS
jgi:hypothetical protein